MEKIITFSIAAYNVEKYLKKLLDSIIEETLLNKIEILIINDGSNDKTIEIAKDYKKKYLDTIKVIDKENGGHGSTINVGIKYANGKYFRAIDGDDWVNTNDLKKLIKSLEIIEVDMVLTNFLKCYEDGKIEKEEFENIIPEKIYSFEEIVKQVKWMCYHSVIYRTKLLKEYDIRLDEKSFYVDAEYMIYPIPYVKTVVFFNYNIYCYRLGRAGQSVSIESRIKHIEDSRKVSYSLLNMYENLCNIQESHRQYIERGIASHCIWHFRTIMSCNPSKERLKELICFEEKIKCVSKKIYENMEIFGKTSYLIKIMRISHYKLYYIISFIKYLKNYLKDI